MLRTHAHPDHVAHESELGVEVVTGPLEVGGLHVEALPTPGHSEDHLAFVVNGELCFSGDILFKDAVGGGSDVPAIRRSVMDVLMKLPPETARPARPHRRDDDRPRVGGEPVRPRLARRRPRGRRAVHGRRRGSVIVVWSPDYDGKGKALVRFADGREAIVGGSKVIRP